MSDEMVGRAVEEAVVHAERHEDFFAMYTS